MLHRMVLAVALVMVLSVGCRRQEEPPPPPPPPPTAEQFVEVRQQLMREDPGAIVGRVAADPESELIIVEGLSMGDAPIGATFVVTDIEQNALGSARVIERTPGRRVIMRYGTSGSRQPREGDLAIRMRQ